MGSALCVFLLAPLNQHLTMHGQREGNWFLASTSAPRWVRGGRRVKGEGWWKGGVDWLWLGFNFLSRKHVHEAGPDWGISSQWCSHFTPICYRFFHLIPVELSNPAYKHPAWAEQERLFTCQDLAAFSSPIIASYICDKLLTFKSVHQWIVLKHQLHITLHLIYP